jgi:methionyl-tRNA formyltransferase
MASMRIALATFGQDEFATLHSACVNAGHTPTTYVYCRSMKPKGPVEHHERSVTSSLLASIPAGMDLLLPATAEGLAHALAGYDLDLLVTYGFNWRLPAVTLTTPRFGVINIHTSLLPRYRGPAPVLWAIRHGDEYTGLTIHRMDEEFDSGPILAQQDGIRLADDVTPAEVARQVRGLLPGLLAEALQQVVDGARGIPQDDAAASYAGFIEPSFSVIDWSRPAREIHNQVRVFRFIGNDNAPVGLVGGRWQTVLRTSLRPGAGARVECADGPIWVLEMKPADPPVMPAAGSG